MCVLSPFLLTIDHDTFNFENPPYKKPQLYKTLGILRIFQRQTGHSRSWKIVITQSEKANFRTSNQTNIDQEKGKSIT